MLSGLNLSRYLRFKARPLIISIFLAFLVFLFNPFMLNLNQSIIFAGFVFTVTAWALEAMHRTFGCLFLISTALIFGSPDIVPVDIFGYLISDANILIMLTTLLSVGIINMGYIHGFIGRVMAKCNDRFGITSLFIFTYIIAAILSLIIPQAFARVILLGTIFDEIISSDKKYISLKEAMMFNLLIAITTTYMFFSNGDILINLSAIKMPADALGIAPIFLNEVKWLKMMSVPTLATILVSLGIIYIIFRKSFKQYDKGIINVTTNLASDNSQNSQQINTPNTRFYFALGLILITALLWSTNMVHHIPETLIISVSVLLLFASKFLNFKDLKSVNIDLIIFLMTVFSVGKIFGKTGISAKIFEYISVLFESDSNYFLLMIVIVVMLLHTIIGSSIATMSVVYPIIMPLAISKGFSPEVIALLVYAVVNIHFYLPFNHAIMMMGAGRGYYADKYMFKFGIYMTVIIIPLLYLVYFKWWNILGV